MVVQLECKFVRPETVWPIKRSGSRDIEATTTTPTGGEYSMAPCAKKPAPKKAAPKKPAPKKPAKGGKKGK